MVNFNFGLGDDNKAQDDGQTGSSTTDPVVQDNTGAAAPLVTFDASAEPNNTVMPEAPAMEAPVEPVFAAEPVIETPTFETPIAEVPVFEPAPVIETPVMETPAVDMFPPVTEPIQTPVAEMPVMDAPVEPVFAAEPVIETPVAEVPVFEPTPVIETPVMETTAVEPVIDMFAPATETPVEPVFSAEPVIETPIAEAPAIDMNFASDPVAQPNEVQASPEPAMPVFGESVAQTETPIMAAPLVENTPEPVQENNDIFIPAFGGDDSNTPVATNRSTSTGDPVQTLGQIQAEIKNFIDEKQSVITEYETEIEELKQEIKDLKDKIKGEEKAVKDKKAEFSKMLKDTQDLIDHFEPQNFKK